MVSFFNSNYMTRRKALILLGVFLIASFSIISLLAFLSRRNINKNGFNRNFVLGVLKIESQKAVAAPVIRLIGAKDDELFFQTNNPNEILKTDNNLTKYEKITLNIQESLDPYSGIHMFLRDNIVYITSRNTGLIFSYDLKLKSATKHFIKDYFKKLVNVSNDQFIFRRYDGKIKSIIFLKGDLKTKDTFIQSDYKQSENDGSTGLLTEGMLLFDEHTKLACYTFFYQNGFVCLDSNLHLTLKARTIDTITKQNIKVSHIRSSITLNEPPPFVNYIGCVSNGKLYLQSMLRADNEYELDFSENTTIDKYNLVNGKYEGSFYFPKHNGKSPYNFNVIGNSLYAVYKNTIVKYALHPPQPLR